MRLFVCGRACVALAALLFSLGTAQAGSFQVNPVRVDLSLQQPVASIMVNNTADQPIVLQLDTVQWMQQDGTEHFIPTQEILATPAVFRIDTGGSQVLRIGLRRKPDTASELSYRLFLQEVLPEAQPDFQGMRVALRVSIPVFVAPTAKASAKTLWQAQRVSPDQLRLQVANTGNAHIKVAQLTLDYQGLLQPFNQQIAEYVLPGQSRYWLLDVTPAPRPGTNLELQIQTDSTSLREMITVN